MRHASPWLLAGLLLAAAAQVATAKSLYVIADIYSTGGQNPIHAYTIGPDGKLTLHTRAFVTMRGIGPVGLALDAKSERLFITFEDTNVIALVNATTLREIGVATVDGAENLAGIVYDQSRERLYCMDRNAPTLYVYQWDATGRKIVPVPGSPFPLSDAQAFGIALDEIKGELYVGGPLPRVRVYSTTDWRLLRTIAVDRTPISVAVDPVRRLLYFGGSYPVTNNFNLAQHNLADGTVKEVSLGSDAGVMGLGVDLNTGFVYVSTGLNNETGSADLRVYDSQLRPVQVIEDVGHPTGLVLPNVATVPKTDKPLGLAKTLSAGGVGGDSKTPASAHAGAELTYRITFDNNDNNFTARNVNLVDTLPPEVTFIRATDDGFFGRHDPNTRTYTWTYPKLASGESNTVELVVRLDPAVADGARITNNATIESDDTPPARASVEVIAINNAPLRLEKTLVRGALDQPDAQGRAQVEPGATLTYEVSFSNPSTNRTALLVSIVDVLPREVRFVNADGDRDFGFYDPNTHTYTWRYSSLEPGRTLKLNLVMRVEEGTPPGTVIRNSASITAEQMPRATTSVEVIVVNPSRPTLTLRKTLVSGGAGQRDNQGRPYVNAGGILTYTLDFSNPQTNKAVTQVVLVDALPREVSFIRADGEREFGLYDPATHSYTWRYSLLASGAEQSVNLMVRVSEKTDPNTVISNTASIASPETGTTTIRCEAVVLPAPITDVQGQMYFKPDHLYRNSSATKEGLMVVVHLPEGIGREAISEASLVLTPGHILATGQVIFGTNTQGKVLCFFNVDAILAATQGYGQFPLTVTGRLRDGRSFACERKIWILKFGGP